MATLELIDLAKRYSKNIWGVKKMDLEVGKIVECEPELES